VTILVLPIRERLRLHDRAYRAQQRDQSEVCGAVVADSQGRCRLVFLPNQSNRPRHFEMRWSDIREIRGGIEGSSTRLVAVFHSHVVGEAVPSKGDLAQPPTTMLSLIYDVCGRSARLWRVRNVKGVRTATEVPLVVESTATASERFGRSVTLRCGNIGSPRLNRRSPGCSPEVMVARRATTHGEGEWRK